jgi:hypothetical protein
VTIERLDDGCWKLVRERDENGETFVCEDLVEAFQTVRAAYAPDGRPWPLATSSSERQGAGGEK